MNVDKIMSTTVVTVEMDDYLKEVKTLFDHTSFHHLLVVDEKKLVGVISDRDLLKVISPQIDTPAETPKDLVSLNKRAHQIMSRQLHTLKPDVGINDAIEIFCQHKISCIPIIDDEGYPIGILSWRDILNLIYQNQQRKKV